MGLSRIGAARTLIACVLSALYPPVARTQVVGPDGPLVVTQADEYEPDVAVVGDRAIAVWQPSPSPSAVTWAYTMDAGVHWVAGPRLPYASAQQGSVDHPSVCM